MSTPFAQPSSTRRGRRSRTERGSAYVVALLVLVLLTIFGLSLALITQTEAQIGDTEKATTRILYNADSGFPIAIARLLGGGDSVGREITLGQRTLGPATVTDRLLLSPTVPASEEHCNLCSINEDPARFGTITHIIGSQAARGSGTGLGQDTLARKQLSLMVEVQPMGRDAIGALRQLHEETDTAKKETFTLLLSQ